MWCVVCCVWCVVCGVWCDDECLWKTKKVVFQFSVLKNEKHLPVRIFGCYFLALPLFYSRSTAGLSNYNQLSWHGSVLQFVEDR